MIWAAFILLLCGLPGENLPNIDFWEINIEDKLAHVFVFAILAILMVMGRFPELTVKYAVIIIVIATLYGALTELLQAFIFPTRFASISDFIADFLGSILGTVFAYIIATNKLAKKQ